jgi:hypothetical protein
VDRKESISLRDAGKEQSNPELVKRKPSSDGRRRIRKWDRQLSQASEGKHGAFARTVPTRPRFGTKSQDGGKDRGCGGWLAGKDLPDSNPPASTPNFLP